MKLYIKQKVFSWADKFFVTDENGTPVYRVEGEMFTLGKKLHIYDMQGREVTFIQQELLHMRPRYNIMMEGQLIAQIRREYTLLRPKYSIIGPELTVEGEFWAHEYQLNDLTGMPVALIHKQWMTWGDTYEVEVADPALELLALSTVIVIDCVQAQAAAAASSAH